MKKYKNFKIGDEVEVVFMPGYIFHIDSFNEIKDPIYGNSSVNIKIYNNIKLFEVDINDIKHSLSHIRNSKIEHIVKK